MRRVLNDVLGQAGVRYTLAGDARGTVTTVFKNLLLEDALWRITQAATPRLAWKKNGDAYFITRAPMPPLSFTGYPRVSVDAQNLRVSQVLAQIFKQAGIGNYRLDIGNIGNAARLSVHLDAVPLDQALTQVCAQATPPLAWSWDQASIVVTPCK